MKTCVINFSDNSFKNGQDRLASALKNVNYSGDILLFNNIL